MERQPQQAALVEVGTQRDDPVAHVQERLCGQPPVRADDADEPRLVHHEQRPEEVRRLHQGDR
jgi:hypothetical protein